MRNSRPNFILTNLADFNLCILVYFISSLKVDGIFRIQGRLKCPAMPPKTRIAPTAQAQSGHRSSEEISGCATYDSEGRLLNGGTCQAAPKQEEEEESRMVSSWGCQEASVKLWRCKIVAEVQHGANQKLRQFPSDPPLTGKSQKAKECFSWDKDVKYRDMKW